MRFLILALSLSATSAEDKANLSTPAEQFKALAKEFNTEGFALRQATTDEEREKVAVRVGKLTQRCLELVEKNPKHPAAFDALVQAVSQEIWMENNTLHVRNAQDSPEAKAIALLLRDHIISDKLGHACWRVSYGFSKECELLLRTALEKSPHKDVQGTACFRLAQFLNGRLHRLDLLKERPEMMRRYEGLFGKDYLDALQHQDRAKAANQVEILFEQAAKQYGDVKLPYGGTIADQAKLELHEIRHLAVGREAQDIEAEDQDGKRFKLSDYRGKVVLLYFWSEY